MGAECGANLYLKVDGDDAAAALDAIISLFDRKFGEE
jgi:phosphotransferase system HPr-like phosphotransfer protein